MDNLEEKTRGVKANSKNEYYSIKHSHSEDFWGYLLALSLVGAPLYVMGEDMRYLSYVFLGAAGLVALMNIYYEHLKK